MSDFKKVFERIKRATNTKTQIDVAEVLGIRQSSISDAKRRNSVPADWCLKLFFNFGLNPEWVISGSGPMYLKTEKGYAPLNPKKPLVANEDPALYGDPSARGSVISVYSMEQTAKKGGEPKVVAKLSMPASFLGPTVTVFRIDSSDMEPLMRKGAYIGVDSDQKTVIAGELYAVRMPYGGIAARRIFPDSGGTGATLKTEDAKHPDTTMPMDKLKSAVLGRVIWTLNRY